MRMLGTPQKKVCGSNPFEKGQRCSTYECRNRKGYCNQLFKIEEGLKDLTSEERFYKRLDLEKPVLEAFWSWLYNLTDLNGSALGKAVTYAKNQKPYMENYLLDGRCSISNNTAENAIRPFTVGRKNWLFADTPK